MLDTNICIYLIKRKPEKVLEKFQSMSLGEVGISSITLSELEFGVSKSSKPQENELALINFVADLEILSYGRAASSQYGPLRSYLENEGIPIGPLDTLIAAHALAIGCALVTNNVSEFERVPDLLIENWVT